MTIASTPVDLIVSKLEGVKRSGSRWMARCPAHDDSTASMSVSAGDDGRALVHCFAGCSVDSILKAVGLAATDLFVPDQSRAKSPTMPPADKQRYETARDAVQALERGRGKRSGMWVYRDASGEPVGAVLRWDSSDGKKSIIPIARIAGGWYMAAMPEPRPLFDLPRIAATPGRVYVVEGEKCCAAMASIGLTATTSAGGSQAAGKTDWGPLAGRDVIIIPDHDDAGTKYAADVAGKIEARVVSLATIWPEIGEGDDVADWIAKQREADVDDAQSRDALLGLGDAAVTPTKFTAPPASNKLGERLAAIVEGKRRAVSWPWPVLGRCTRALLPGTITMLCGGAGAAKSMLIGECCLHWLSESIPFAAFFLEEDREFYLHRALAQLANDARLMDDEWARKDDNGKILLARYAEHSETIDAFGRSIWDAPDNEMKMADILDWVRERVRDGRRIVIVDPITAADSGKEPWAEDRRFVNGAKKALRDSDASLIVVTHPRDGNPKHGDRLDNLAGGRAYSRFSQTVIWLEVCQDDNSVSIQANFGSVNQNANRVLSVSKARNGKGDGFKIAYWFDRESLRFVEHGVMEEKR